MKSLYSFRTILKGCMVAVSLMSLVCSCVDKSSAPVADKKVAEEKAQSPLEKTVQSYQESVCGRKFLEALAYVCPKDQKEGGKKPEIWKKYFPAGSACAAYTSSGVTMDASGKMATVNSLIEQKVYPPTGAGSSLPRWLKMHETWKEVEGKWCIDEVGVDEISLVAPDNKSVSTSQ